MTCLRDICKSLNSFGLGEDIAMYFGGFRVVEEESWEQGEEDWGEDEEWSEEEGAEEEEW
jgi:hypothetical protein